MKNKIIDKLDKIDSIGEDNLDCIKFNGLQKAITLINNFCKVEYGSVAALKDLSNISIAYTEDEEFRKIQVYVDLKNYEIRQYVDNELWNRYKYKSLNDLIKYELESLDFDDLVSFDKNEGGEEN